MNGTQSVNPSAERTTPPPYMVVQHAVTTFGIAPAGMTITGVVDYLIQERSRAEGRKFDPDMAQEIANSIEVLCNQEGVDRSQVWKRAAQSPKPVEVSPQVIHMVACMCGCGRVYEVPVTVQAVVGSRCSLENVFRTAAQRLASPGPEPVADKG